MMMISRWRSAANASLLNSKSLQWTVILYLLWLVFWDKASNHSLSSWYFISFGPLTPPYLKASHSTGRMTIYWVVELTIDHKSTRVLSGSIKITPRNKSLVCDCNVHVGTGLMWALGHYVQSLGTVDVNWWCSVSSSSPCAAAYSAMMSHFMFLHVNRVDTGNKWLGFPEPVWGSKHQASWVLMKM